MKTYITIGLGTIGKTVSAIHSNLQLLYRRDAVPNVSFDSDGGMAVPIFSAEPDNAIALNIDGHDVAEAFRSGKYGPFRYIDPTVLRTYQLAGAMKLDPAMGNLASMVHISAIRTAVARLVEGASGGELTVIRVHSSFGGTSRGAADKINEILWEISRSSGLRMDIMDIVAVPGLSTVSSSFHKLYKRNTFAYIKEMAALRTGRFQRMIYDDDGNSLGERHELLPHTLALVNDTCESGILPLEHLMATMARFIELITRPEVSRPYIGITSDLERHSTTAPFADRLGMFSLFVPNREEMVRRQHILAIEALSQVIESRDNHSEIARRLLEGMGLFAPEAEQLKIWTVIRDDINQSLGTNLTEQFSQLYSGQPVDYMFQYNSLTESIGAVNTEDIGAHILEGILAQNTVDDHITLLRKTCPPGEIPAVLDAAISILEQELENLKASVGGDDAGIYALIDEYEDNANLAASSFAAAKRSKSRRNDALSEAKNNLLSALELRVKSASLKVFTFILSGILEAIANDEIESWTEIEKDSRDMLQALKELRDEQISACNLLENGYLRGNSASLGRMGNADSAMPGVPPVMLRGLLGIIQRMYGQPCEAIKQEVMSYIQRRLRAVQAEDEQLSYRHITQSAFTDALRHALPLLRVDRTSLGFRRGIFCLSNLECRDMMARAVADTGIQLDREAYVRIHGVNDELTLLVYDKGVPLVSIKALQDCRNQYLRDDERHKGHLEPLYELLPDPLNANGDGRMYLLMGIISGFVEETEDDHVYLDMEGVAHTVTDSFFTEYDRAVETASRFIVNLKKFGFAPALRQAENAMRRPEFHDAAGELLPKLERYSAIYGNQ